MRRLQLAGWTAAALLSAGCTGLESTETAIYMVSAQPPAFDTCLPEENQLLVMLGDGTTIGPFSGFFLEQSSYDNDLQFAIRLGVDRVWVQVYGNAQGLMAGQDVTLTTPAEEPGNVLIGLQIDPSLAGPDADLLAGSYGIPAEEAWETVDGSVSFDSTPGWDSGTFWAVLQHEEQRQRGNIITAGLRGCFDTAGEIPP